MTRTARQSVVLAGVWTAVAVAAVVPVGAEEPLPEELLMGEGPLAAKQQEIVTQYATFWADKLCNGTDEEVVSARMSLADPLGRGATEDFAAFYSGAVSGGMDKVLESDRLLVRLNAMIVVSKLNVDQNILSIMTKGLHDDSPAVCYWAVKCIRSATEKELDPGTREVLVRELGGRLDGELVSEVLEQVFVALVDLSAVSEVHRGLNARLRAHVGRWELPYQPERTGLRGLFKNLITLNEQGRNVDDHFRQTARASVRFTILLSKQAAAVQDGQPENLAKDNVAMAGLCDQALRHIHTKFDSAVSQPPSIGPALFSRNWQQIHNIALAWREVLSKSPFDFTDAELTIAAD